MDRNEDHRPVLLKHHLTINLDGRGARRSFDLQLNHAFHLHANAVLKVVIEDGEQIDCADFVGRHFPLDVDVKFVLLTVGVLIKLAELDNRMRKRIH